MSFIFFLVFITANGEYKNTSRLRGTALSSYKKVKAGYKPLIYYCPGYYIYTLLATVLLFFKSKNTFFVQNRISKH